MFVTDIDTFKKYVPTVEIVPYKKLAPHIISANDDLCNDILGISLYEKQDEFTEALNPLCERFVCMRAYERAIPFLDLKQTEQGFAVIDTQGLIPASKERVAALVKASKADGDKAEDKLMLFLESMEAGELKDLWLDSDACTYLTDTYLSTFREFKRYCPSPPAEVKIPENRREFAELRGNMRAAIQFKFIPVISDEFNSVLLEELRNNTISVENKRIIEPLKFATAVYAIGLYAKSDEYLRQALSILRNNPDAYELWKNSDVGKAELNRVEKENDGSIYFGGF